MDKSKKIIYENVVPTKNNQTIKIQFKDNYDIIIEEKKNTEINFAKKINNFFFFNSFRIFCIHNNISLQNIF